MEFFSLGMKHFKLPSRLLPHKFISHALARQPHSKSYSNLSYYHRIGEQPLRYENFGQQIQRAAKHYGDRHAIISCHEGQCLTFAQATRKAEVLALKLNELGLKRGEHLAIWAPNTIQWYVTLLAASLAGFPLACLNPALQAPELQYSLRKSKAKALVTMDACGKVDFHKILNDALANTNDDGLHVNDPNLPHLKRIIMRGQEAVKNFVDFEYLLGSSNFSPAEFSNLNKEVSEIKPESVSNIQFTSGTTGQPKCALLSHFGLVNSAYYMGKYLNLDKSHKKVCLTVPFFHVYGLAIAAASITHGATLVMPSASFHGASCLEVIEKEKCQIIVGAPTMYVDLIENQRKLKRNLQSLELGMSGGAALSPEVNHQIKAVLGLEDMRIGYGLTECSGASHLQDGTETADEALATVGKLYEHMEAKVVNAKGDTVPLGQPGELCMRGFLTMQGYYEDEEKTKEVLQSGWFRTGDEFIMEANGKFLIFGRKKDLIIRGGENVFPKEIEDFLDTHSDILEAQVVGVPDYRLGEEICAYLRLKPEAKALTEADIKLYCKGKLAHFKVPRYVRIVDEFPKTTSGKIQKFKLKQMFQHEHDK